MKKDSENKRAKRSNDASEKPKNKRAVRTNKAKAGKNVRRARSDSVTVAVNIAQSVGKDLMPPDWIELSATEKRCFDEVTAEMATIEWSDHTLAMAAKLAQAMAGHERELRLLKDEGAIIKQKNKKGVIIGRIKNPRKDFMVMYMKDIIALRRSLSIHARGKDGESRDIKKRRDAAKEQEKKFDDLGDKMSLIARPETFQ